MVTLLSMIYVLHRKSPGPNVTDLRIWELKSGIQGDTPCPSGLLKIAQQFIAGTTSVNPNSSPVGTAETGSLMFSRPYRTHVFPSIWYPAINHWANTRCPYGTRTLPIFFLKSVPFGPGGFKKLFPDRNFMLCHSVTLYQCK